MFRRNSKANKAKLEHKLCIARNTPEPIFDLSECDIQDVPSGVYSLCKVFLKEILQLHTNRLTSLSNGGQLSDLSLLRVLDLRSNKFSTLPKDIDMLKSLQELYISNNVLISLPENVCNLTCLTILDISKNKLHQLPQNIGNLVMLTRLNISFNPKLITLPISIVKAKKLILFEFDGNDFQYPPSEVVSQGLDSIRRWICIDVGMEYVALEDSVDFSSVSSDTQDQRVEKIDDFTVKLWKLETIKQQKVQNFLEIERQNEMIQKQEFELAIAQKHNRQKLLEDITVKQNIFDKELEKIQKLKESEKFHLIEQLVEAEQNTFTSINHLLEINREPLTRILEIEKEEEERLLAAATTYNDNLKTEEILHAMQNILVQENLQFQKIYQEKHFASQGILKEQIEWETQLSEIVKNREFAKEELKTKLVDDMVLQKAALGTLLERNDARSWSLVQQVAMVEAQLAALTHIELDKRKLEMDAQVNDIAHKRMELSVLLMDLLDQQQIRRSEILLTLESLEKQWDKVSEDYWIKQYQDLLGRTPEGIANAQKNLNPKLAECLLVNGVIHCLPYIARLILMDCDMQNLNEDTLIKAGILSAIDRKHILIAFKDFNKCHKDKSPELEKEIEVAEASAPPAEEENELSAVFTGRSYIAGSLAECVICMDQECQIIFIPCGHITSCLACSASLQVCPLCRTNIERKIQLMGSS